MLTIIVLQMDMCTEFLFLLQQNVYHGDFLIMVVAKSLPWLVEQPFSQEKSRASRRVASGHWLSCSDLAGNTKAEKPTEELG